MCGVGVAVYLQQFNISDRLHFFPSVLCFITSFRPSHDSRAVTKHPQRDIGKSEPNCLWWYHSDGVCPPKTEAAEWSVTSGSPSEGARGMREEVGLLWGHQKRRKEGVVVLLMRRKSFSKELELEVIDTVCQKDKGRAIVWARHENQSEALKRALNTHHIMMHRNTDFISIIILQGNMFITCLVQALAQHVGSPPQSFMSLRWYN